MSKFDEIAYMKWHEDGYVTVLIDEDSSFVSSEPIMPDEEWRGYKGEAAWDRDYWDFTDEEIEWLNTITWE